MTLPILLLSGLSVGVGMQIGAWVCIQIQGFMLGAIQAWQRGRKGEDVQRLPMCERCCAPCATCLAEASELPR